MTERPNPWGLTLREMEVLDTFCEKFTSKGVAQVLPITLKTIETHMQRARKKSGARNQLEMLLQHDRIHRGVG